MLLNVIVRENMGGTMSETPFVGGTNLWQFTMLKIKELHGTRMKPAVCATLPNHLWLYSASQPQMSSKLRHNFQLIVE